MVCAEHPGLVSEQAHDAVGEEVRGHMGINSCQGVVKKVHGLVLSKQVDIRM